MVSLTVRRKIMGIAVALIVLMAVTAVLSMASVIQVGDQLDELTRSYIPAYGNLAVDGGPGQPGPNEDGFQTDDTAGSRMAAVPPNLVAVSDSI